VFYAKCAQYDGEHEKAHSGSESALAWLVVFLPSLGPSAWP
ncbi:hypothetical protein HAL07_06950, partial [Helicobacter ailurogastricus]